MAFLGLRGTGDWVTDARPTSYREGILFNWPNGEAVLTALTAKMSSERVNDPQFNWWTKTLPAQRATVTGVYTNSGLSTAYVSGGSAGDTLYIKMAEAESKEFRAGHQILLRDASDETVDVNAKVTASTQAGASSYLTVSLLEDDDNSASGDLSDCDTALIIGSINPEGGTMPTAVAYDPVKWYNYTQIFRTPLDITRTALRTRLRTGDHYKEAKRECLQLHSIEMEKAFLFGIRTEGTGSNGKPERTTMGLISAVRAGAPGNCSNYSTDSAYSGTTWLNGGEHWLDTMLEKIFRYGSGEKMAICGSGARLAITRLAKNQATLNVQPGKQIGYGMSVSSWLTDFGTIHLKTHPLFNYEATLRNTMVIFEPALLRFRYVDDTTFYAEGEKQNTGTGRVDARAEEFLTEAGLEYHHPTAMGVLTGLGVDNS